MILPLPSSPHCAPIKIVFAISVPNLGKKFSRRIWQDAVGTCLRMIRTTRARASGFAGGPRKKDDRSANGPRSQIDAHYITHHPDHSTAGSFADVAIQHWL